VLLPASAGRPPPGPLGTTGLAFFGSLGDRAHAVLDGFTEDELQVITRFITAMADSTRQHVRELEGRQRTDG
jgi:hypothetical protein